MQKEYTRCKTVFYENELNQLDYAVPVFFEGCGYRAELHNAEKFDAALETLDLPPEILQKLKHELQLEAKRPPIRE